MGEAYTCAAGGVIAAGVFVAPVIVGTTWTPRFDGSGNITDGNWAGLPLNTWLRVSGQKLIDVVEQPPYASFTGEDAITDAWNGAAWDYVNQEMHFGGGGHGDTSACETGMYKLSVKKMMFSRTKDRSPLSALQSWDAVNQIVDSVDHHDAKNVPLLDGAPGAVHVYHGLIWIPPAIMGNAKGGVFFPGAARAVLNLDTAAWTTCHFNDLMVDQNPWGDTTAFLDGETIYGQDAGFYHRTFRLNTMQATTYSQNSYGTFTARAIPHGNFTEGGGLWADMRERREEVSFTQTGSFSRMRYGQAIDAAASNWSVYQDAITLTSADGSHADFNVANLSQNGDPAAEGMFASCGTAYDHSAQALYVQGNKVGSQLYRITGLASNTWTTEKLAGTGALEFCKRGTYGRMRLAVLAGKKVLIRVSGTRHLPQVMRVS